MKKNIRVGDIAPSIQTIDLWENRISVPRQDKWIYLSFHRFAACPFCNLRTNELIQNYKLFQNHKVDIVSLWPSSKDSLLQFVGKEKSPFPIVSDSNKNIYRAYGVTESSSLGAVKLLFHPRLIYDAMRSKHKDTVIDSDPKMMPTSFLISPDGIIQMAYYGKHFGDHPKIEAILTIIKQE